MNKNKRHNTLQKPNTLPLALLILAVAALASICVVRTVALFTDTTGKAINELTISDVKVSIEEDFDPDETIGTNTNIPPLTKIPKIVNESTVPVFVRVTVAGGIDKFIINREEAGGFVDGKWTESPLGSGVWYYSDRLEPKGVTGDKTTPLFTSVKLKAEYDGNGTDLDIAIYAEVVQADWVNYTDYSDPAIPAGTARYAKDAFEAFEVLDGKNPRP